MNLNHFVVFYEIVRCGYKRRGLRENEFILLTDSREEALHMQDHVGKIPR